MALFKKKPPGDGNGDGDGGDDGTFEPQPEKARKWFAHAKTSADSYNFEYALTCFATGIKLDPALMAAHRAMLESAVNYANNGGKPAASKEVRSISDGTPVGRFAAAEFEWMKDLKNYKSAVRMLDAAVKAELVEVGAWIAPRVLSLLRNQKKLSKSSLVQAMELFRGVGAWDESMVVGEMARQLDPTDADLANEIKNLSAQRAMDQGGYEQAAREEGGFRKFIKDADKQQELIEQESLAGGASVEERNLARAAADYEASPSLPDAINRYAQLLKKQGTDEAVEAARRIYEKGFADSGEYRFRMAEGDIRIERLDGERRALEEKLAASPDDADLKTQLEAKRTEMLALKAEEYAARVERYPTDRARRFELGQVQFDLGNYEDAMAEFQKSKDEPKLKVRSGHLLGRCFFEVGWYSDAVAELQDALGAIDATEKERELAVRYDLMVSLLESAREEQSVDLAREAKTMCSDIARRDITYRDIRSKRREVDELIKSMSGAT